MVEITRVAVETAASMSPILSRLPRIVRAVTLHLRPIDFPRLRHLSGNTGLFIALTFAIHNNRRTWGQSPANGPRGFYLWDDDIFIRLPTITPAVVYS